MTSDEEGATVAGDHAITSKEEAGEQLQQEIMQSPARGRKQQKKIMHHEGADDQ